MVRPPRIERLTPAPVAQLASHKTADRLIIVFIIQSPLIEQCLYAVITKSFSKAGDTPVIICIFKTLRH